MSRLIAFALALALASVPATRASAQTASDFSAVLGAWEMTLETPRGSMTQTLTFVAEGDELTGLGHGPQRDHPASERLLRGWSNHLPGHAHIAESRDHPELQRDR